MEGGLFQECCGIPTVIVGPGSFEQIERCESVIASLMDEIRIE